MNKLFLVKIQFREKLYSTEDKMKIPNLERRNSEYALIESQRELGSQRRQFVEVNQWAHQAQREKIQWCRRFEMKNRLQESYARSCREIEKLKSAAIKREILENDEDWKNFLIRNHEESTSCCDSDLRSSSSSYHLESKNA